MNIGRINLSNYNPKISFGEADGSCYQSHDPYPPRNAYERAKREINDKFDLKRDRLFKCYFGTDKYENAIDRLEAARERELQAVDETCRKCINKRKLRMFNPLRLLGLVK